MEALGWRQ